MSKPILKAGTVNKLVNGKGFQGDTYIKEIDTLPDSFEATFKEMQANNFNSKVIIEGEGHHLHEVHPANNAFVMREFDKSKNILTAYVKVLDPNIPTVYRHVNVNTGELSEEHAAFELEPYKTYLITTQREGNTSLDTDFNNLVRRAVD